MAKHTSGIPEGFDLNVTSEELVGGPAKIAGYLDTDPVMALLKARQEAEARVEPVQPPPTMPQPPQRPGPVVTQPVPQAPRTPIARPAVNTPQPAFTPPPEVKAPAVPFDRKRLQINLDAESKRMLADLVDLTSAQSRGYQIKVSEVIQAMLSILHRAKNDIVLGPLPPRGRWGTQSQRTFHTALAEAFREAIVAYEQASGGNPFKNVSNR